MEETADIFVRSEKMRSVCAATLFQRKKGDPVQFGMSFRSFDGNKEKSLVLTFDEAELEKVVLSDPDADEFCLLDDKGKKTKYTFNWNRCQDPTGRFTSYSGQYRCARSGQKFDFFASTDPHPAVVIVGIIAGACLLLYTIDRLTTTCSEEQARNIDACQEAGGLPQMEVGASFEFSFNPFQAGCGVTCNFQCLPGGETQTAALERPAEPGIPVAYRDHGLVTSTVTRTQGEVTETTTTTYVGNPGTFMASTRAGGEQCTISVYLTKVTIDDTTPTGNDWRLRIRVDGDLVKTYYPVAFDANNEWEPAGNGLVDIKTTDRCGRMEEVLIEVEAEQFDNINESARGFNRSKAICTRGRRKEKTPRVLVNVFDNNDEDNASSTLTNWFRVTWECSGGDTSSTATTV